MAWMLFAETDIWAELWKQGILAVMFAGFAWAVWQVIKWGRDNVATPVIKAHMELIATLNSAIPAQGKALSDAKNSLDKQTVSLLSTEQNIMDIRTSSFEHLALQRTEMTHLEDIRDAGKAQADMMRLHVTKIDDHHAWAEKALDGLKEGIKQEVKEELKKELEGK